MIRENSNSLLKWLALSAPGIILFSAALLHAQQHRFPPRSNSRNNPAGNKCYAFQVPDVNNVPDLHGNSGGAKLFFLSRAISLWCFPGWFSRLWRSTLN